MTPKPKDKPKTASLQSLPPPAIDDLFASLNRHIQRSEFEEAAKVADQVLLIAPGDEDAIRCKVVALIKVENIDDALSTINSTQSAPVDLNFHKAYCLYRRNNLDEALECLKNLEKNSENMLLESQILYRMGKMDACMDIYQKLQKFKIDSLEINFVAGLVMAGRAADVPAAMDSLRIKATSSFELAYNTACSLLERNKYADAEQLLLSARRIGQESLMDENLLDVEIEMELAPVAVQLAYVQQLLGRTQESIESFTKIIKRDDVLDEASRAVAINNLIALKGPKDVSDGLKKLDRLKDRGVQNFQLARGLDQKLSQRQKEAVYLNRVLLLLHANKMDQARELVFALPTMFPESVMPAMLQAAVLVRENKAGKAEEILAQCADKFPEKSKLLYLARAQIAAAAGHHHVAADSLVRISDIQHMPALVATLISLKERTGDVDGAAAVFDAAIRWWSNAMTEDNKRDVMMLEAASFKLKHGKEDEAAMLYEQLVEGHESIEALVGLITTVAGVDVDKAEEYEKRLKPLPGVQGLDADGLERTSGAKLIEDNSHVECDAFEEGKIKTKAKKKRKRKPRYPKGFDPANPGPPPDPERWLPKRERSSYRPKRKDKRTAQVRGAQGAVIREKQETSGVGLSSNSTSKQNAPAEPAKPSKSRKKSRK